MDNIKITLEHSFPVEKVKNLIIDAMEGGSNHWYCMVDRSRNSDLYADEPFIEGGFIDINDSRADEPTMEPKTYVRLDIDRIKNGLRIFAEKEPRHFEDFLSDNDDATTADVFLQYCVFGEVIYA